MSFKIVMIGAGNLAHHLSGPLKAAGHEIVQVYSPGGKSARALAQKLSTDYCGHWQDIYPDADMYILAVRDYAIDEAILNLKLPGKTVIHCSGTVPMLGMERISSKCGVMYPLQTLRTGQEINWTDVPVFIEASDKIVEKQLQQLASALSPNIIRLSSEDRSKVHLVAVFVNNFVNFLLKTGYDLCLEENLKFEWFQPLIRKTMEQAMSGNPADFQTGPARRKDVKTIDEHLQMLDDHPDMKEIYLVMTEALMAHYGRLL